MYMSQDRRCFFATWTMISSLGGSPDTTMLENHWEAQPVRERLERQYDSSHRLRGHINRCTFLNTGYWWPGSNRGDGVTTPTLTLERVALMPWAGDHFTRSWVRLEEHISRPFLAFLLFYTEAN